MTPRKVTFAVSIFCLTALIVSPTYSSPIRTYDISDPQDLVTLRQGNMGFFSHSSAVPFDLQTGEKMYDNVLYWFAQQIDISPNGRYLSAVANSTSPDRPSESWVLVHDLKMKTWKEFWFARESNEGAPFDAVFADNSTLMITSYYNGSGHVPLRQMDLKTGSTTKLAIVEGESRLRRTFDNSGIVIAERSGAKPITYFDIKSGKLTSAGWRPHYFRDAVANSDGTAFAAIGSTGVELYGEALGFRKAYRPEDTNFTPVGAAFSSDSSVLFVSWTYAVHRFSSNPYIAAYDAKTLRLVEIIDPSPYFGSLINSTDGELWLSTNGRLLFAQNQYGLSVYDVSKYSAAIIPEPDTVALLVFVGLTKLCYPSRQLRRMQPR